MNKIILVAIALIFVSTSFYAFTKIHKSESSRTTKDVSYSNAISFTKKEFEIKGKMVIVELVIVDTSQASIGITSPEIIERNAPVGGYDGYSLEEYLSFGKYSVVQSGGFLSSWSPALPLGFVKIQGKEYNQVHDTWITKGVFCTDGNEFEIFKFESTQQFKKWRSCIQAGPPIIINSEVVLDTSRNTWYVTGEAHQQSFICKKMDGNLVMGISSKVSLRELAKHMIKPEEKDGFGCTDSVLLTSKGISGILAKTPDYTHATGNTKVPLPNAIVVK